MSVAPDASPPLLKIGEVCERVGLSLRTVRYYEEVGLLTPTDRSPGGFRLYSESDVERLAVLKGMKPLGLTLEEIRELMEMLDLASSGDHLRSEQADRVEAGLTGYAQRAEARIVQLEGHVVEVQRLRRRMLEALE